MYEDVAESVAEGMKPSCNPSRIQKPCCAVRQFLLSLRPQLNWHVATTSETGTQYTDSTYEPKRSRSSWSSPTPPSTLPQLLPARGLLRGQGLCKVFLLLETMREMMRTFLLRHYSH